MTKRKTRTPDELVRDALTVFGVNGATLRGPDMADAVASADAEPDVRPLMSQALETFAANPGTDTHALILVGPTTLHCYRDNRDNAHTLVVAMPTGHPGVKSLARWAKRALRSLRP